MRRSLWLGYQTAADGSGRDGLHGGLIKGLTEFATVAD
jgi:hypothetical protein